MNACPVAAGAVSTGTWPSLVGHLTGGQGVAGSNPAVPTRTCRSEGVSGVSRDSFLIVGSQTGSHSRGGFAGSGGLRPLLLTENLVHGRRARGERGPDLVPVDGLGNGRAAVAHQVADVLDADAAGAED